MPELLSDITRDELARRQRAHEFERLSNRAGWLRATIARLSTPVDTAALTAIGDLVPQIPDDLVTRGLQGGYAAKGLLRQIVVHALQDLGYREEKRVAELDAAQKEIAQVEAALAAFN